MCEIDQLQHCLGTRLQLGQGGQHGRLVVGETSIVSVTADLLGRVDHHLVKILGFGGPDVVTVDVLELDEVEARRPLVEALEREPLDHLLDREQLVVAMPGLKI